jgi:hypothetical protein
MVSLQSPAFRCTPGALIAAIERMPKAATIEKAKRALRQGKSPSTAAGEFIRVEMDRMKDHDEHAPHTREQAIAIGLAQARRAGVPLPPQPESHEETRQRRSMQDAYKAGKKVAKRRKAAVKRA